MYDPAMLMKLARLGAESMAEVIKEHFPDLIPGPKRPMKSARKEAKQSGKPGPREVPVLRAKHGNRDKEINPKTGKPYVWSKKQREAKAQYFKSAKGKAHLKRMQEAGQKARKAS